MYKSKEQKRIDAEAMAAERAKRSPKEQLARLDHMLGKGQGAVKERARLQAQIDNKHKKPKEEVEEPDLTEGTVLHDPEAPAEKVKKVPGRRQDKKTEKKVRKLPVEAKPAL